MPARSAFSEEPAKEALEELLEAAGSDVVVLSDNPAGFPAGLLRIELPVMTGDPVADAHVWLGRHAPAFGVLDTTDELRFERSRHVGGRHIVIFEQVCEGLPVVGGEVRLIIESDGTLRSILSSFMPVSDDQPIEPRYDADWALEQALKDLGGFIATPSGMRAEHVTRQVFFSPSGTEPLLCVGGPSAGHAPGAQSQTVL